MKIEYTELSFFGKTFVCFILIIIKEKIESKKATEKIKLFGMVIHLYSSDLPDQYAWFKLFGNTPLNNTWSSGKANF